jgi:hypothetical protein
MVEGTSQALKFAVAGAIPQSIRFSPGYQGFDGNSTMRVLVVASVAVFGQSDDFKAYDCH